MYPMLIAATLLLGVSTLPAFADKTDAPTLKILAASGFGCKAVDSGILHCSNPNTKDQYDCTPDPDAPCQGTPPLQAGGRGGKVAGMLKLQGNLARAHN